MNITNNYQSGRVLRGLPFSLARHDTVSIGSDKGCDIVISGADPHHAELRWEENAAAWFVLDNPAPGPTIVNGRPIESILLRNGDWFDVAGVRICFSEEMLRELDATKPVGIRVTLRGVSAIVDGKRRLDNVSFQVHEGSFVALLGPSGGGKSTLIQRISGLAPFEGDIRLNGHDIRTGKKRLLPLVAYLPQRVDDTLHADMTVREAMEDFARCHLGPGAQPNFDARLKDVGLEDKDFPEKTIGDLSGGQKRRLAIALALLRDPQLLLLDEPTAGLDPAAEVGIMTLLRDIANQGRTVLCATHVLSSLDQCDDVVVLTSEGRVAFFGTPKSALEHFVEHFGAKDWLAVYQTLCGNGIGAFPIDAPIDSEPRSLPSSPPSASFHGAFCAIFQRLAKAAFSKRNAALFVGIPLGIAAVLLIACWLFFDDDSRLGTIYFCMAVAMFWLGLSGTVRSFVAERVPKRCLDRMRGMPIFRYFAAHAAFAAATVAIQSLLFVFPIFLLQLGNKSLAAFPKFWVILFMIGFAGSCVGLFVSAYSKKELQAVWALPFIAVLALFFGKPVLEGGTGEKPTGFLRIVERAMPTFHTQNLLASQMDLERHRNWQKPLSDERAEEVRGDNTSNWRWFAILAAGYPVVFLSLAFFFQNRRERQWNGR